MLKDFQDLSLKCCSTRRQKKKTVNDASQSLLKVAIRGRCQWCHSRSAAWRDQQTNSECEDEPKLAFFRCRKNKQDCQTCWGIKSLPWHHVITVNITRHPDSCFKGLSGITGCSYKTINSHLNVPSSLLFWASFHFFKPLSSHNPSLSLINSSLLPWAPLIYSAAECC